jgi:hypothetical protein
VPGGISRRAFVCGCSIAVTVSALPVLRAVAARNAVSPGPRNVAVVSPDSLWARSRFTPFVGATFRVTGGETNVDVVLAEVRDLRPVLRAADEKRFSLLFTAARQHVPADGIRTFRNHAFGAIDMFVSPVGPGTEPLRYQVVINRL